jgi:hypothetical protein
MSAVAKVWVGRVLSALPAVIVRYRLTTGFVYRPSMMSRSHSGERRSCCPMALSRVRGRSSRRL